MQADTVHYLRKISFVSEDGVYTTSVVVSTFTSPSKFEAVHILRPEEFQRFEAYKYSKRKESYYNGRVSGKIAVSDFLTQSFQDFYIDKGVFSQPIVCSLTKNTCQVSISHSDMISASIAFDEHHPLGIDIEMKSKENSLTIEEVLTVKEKEFCINGDISLILWTAKEALSKVLKTGLTIPIWLFEIKEFTAVGSVYSIAFKNFSQYKVISFFFKENVVSIAYPSTSQLDLLNFNVNNFEEIKVT